MASSPQPDIRRTILDVTRELLIEQGITQLSIRMIARQVGCSVGTIYFYFHNKDELIHSLIEEGFEKLIELQDHTEAEFDNPLQRLEQLCRNYIQFGLDNPAYYEIMFMLNPERMARFPAEKYRRARRSVEVVASALKECRDQGLLSVGEPYIHAHLIWSFMHGVVTLLKAKRIDRRIDPAEMISATIRHILQQNSH